LEEIIFLSSSVDILSSLFWDRLQQMEEDRMGDSAGSQERMLGSYEIEYLGSERVPGTSTLEAMLGNAEVLQAVPVYGGYLDSNTTYEVAYLGECRL
jgi:hypothetical protein